VTGPDGLGWRAGGWWRGARAVPSPNHAPRPRADAVTLAVVHSISLPPGCYGGDAIAALFQNRLDHDADPYFDALRGLRVSAHFVVRRDGELLQFVGVDRCAWHAGRSCWRGRHACNDWSVGIELEGLEGDRFEPVQYHVLASLLRVLRRRYPIREVVGHEHVAPGRKADPGAGFDWRALRRLLRADTSPRQRRRAVTQQRRGRAPRSGGGAPRSRDPRAPRRGAAGARRQRRARPPGTPRSGNQPRVSGRGWRAQI
jgi:AmpD protein